MYYYTIDTNGDVISTTTVTQIDRAPEGWQEYELSWERGLEYYGMFRAYSTPLKFFKSGAKILRHIYGYEGFEGKCTFVVKMLDPSDYTYGVLFSADLDFTTYVDEYDYVGIGVIESGFMNLLSSRADTKYTFDLADNTDAKWIEHDGINMQAKLLFSSGVGNPSYTYAGNGFDEFPALYYVDKEGTNISTKMYDVSPSGPEQRQIFVNTTPDPIDYEINVKGFYTITTNNLYTGGAYFAVRALIYPGLVSVSTGLSYIYEDTGFLIPTLSTNSWYVNETVTVTVPSGYAIAITHLLVGASNGTWSTDLSDIEVSVKFTNRYQTSYIPTLRASKLFELLVDKINEGNTVTVTAESDLLTTVYNDEIYITSGDGVRSLPKAKMKISFNDLFQFVKRKFGASLIYDYATDTIKLDEMVSAFNNNPHSTYPSIGEVKYCRVLPLLEQQFVSLKIGSPASNYDSSGKTNEITNGRDEFNTETLWTTPLTKVKNTSDYISPIKCDMYGIEMVRMNNEGKELTSDRIDDDLFAIHAEAVATGTYKLLTTGVTVDTYPLYRKAINLTPGSTYWNVTGIFSPETAYNFIFSPVRSIRRNAPWFKCLLWTQAKTSLSLTFQSAGANNASGSHLVTYEGSPSLETDERADLLIDNLCDDSNVLALPHIFEVETKNVFNLFKLIGDDPYKYVTFEYNGATFNGFIIKSTIKPTFDAGTVFRLLATTGNDLTLLIR